MASKDPTFEELLAKVRQLPPMDEEEAIEQKISFAFGNLNLSRWHDGKPEIPKSVFAQLAWRDAWRKQRQEIAALKQALADETSTVNALAELLWSTPSR